MLKLGLCTSFSSEVMILLLGQVKKVTWRNPVYSISKWCPIILTNNSYSLLFSSLRICSGIDFANADSLCTSYKDAVDKNPLYQLTAILLVVEYK